MIQNCCNQCYLEGSEHVRQPSSEVRFPLLLLRQTSRLLTDVSPSSRPVSLPQIDWLSDGQNPFQCLGFSAILATIFHSQGDLSDWLTRCDSSMDLFSPAVTLALRSFQVFISLQSLLKGRVVLPESECRRK